MPAKRILSFEPPCSTAAIYGWLRVPANLIRRIQLIAVPLAVFLTLLCLRPACAGDDLFLDHLEAADDALEVNQYNLDEYERLCYQDAIRNILRARLKQPGFEGLDSSPSNLLRLSSHLRNLSYDGIFYKVRIDSDIESVEQELAGLRIGYGRSGNAIFAKGLDAINLRHYIAGCWSSHVDADGFAYESDWSNHLQKEFDLAQRESSKEESIEDLTKDAMNRLVVLHSMDGNSQIEFHKFCGWFLGLKSLGERSRKAQTIDTSRLRPELLELNRQLLSSIKGLQPANTTGQTLASPARLQGGVSYDGRHLTPVEHRASSVHATVSRRPPDSLKQKIHRLENELICRHQAGQLGSVDVDDLSGQLLAIKRSYAAALDSHRTGISNRLQDSLQSQLQELDHELSQRGQGY